MVVGAMNRLADLRRFYDLLGRLAVAQEGPRRIVDLFTATLPKRGVYFFFEPGEVRRESGDGPRVVRVGTHALRVGATSTLRGRLRQHGGTRSGSGNHRGSIFRLLTGDALIRGGRLEPCASWGAKNLAAFGMSAKQVKVGELVWEQAVSRHLDMTQVVYLNVPDEPGPESLRARIERNAIALLSNEGKEPLDPPSNAWLGYHSSRPHVRASGLWNQNHVDEIYRPEFLDELASLVERQ
jgi:hypothetical protein